jgi:hypothetical protein
MEILGEREAAQPRTEGIRATTDIADLPIGVLHAGVKTATVERAGFRVLSDLDAVSQAEIIRIPTVGRRTADVLFRNRDALVATAFSETSPDWDGYCAAAGVALLPSSAVLQTGRDFVASIPLFLVEVADTLADSTISSILRDRISRPSGKQTTLEEIALTTVPPLTRERIRQIEKKLLGQLTGGLLNDRYDGLDIHFRPEFSRWWRVAADSLEDLDEITYEDFLARLGHVWDVPRSLIAEHLPAILAIVTGEPQMPAGFRKASKVDHRLRETAGGKLRATALRQLRMGKTAARLEDVGVRSVGEILDSLDAGTLGAAGPSTLSRMEEHLNILADCLDKAGEVDWAAYRTATGLPCVPASPPGDGCAFATDLAETIATILKAAEVSKRAPEIFVHRTRHDIGKRKTLEQTAAALSTVAPTVKREETVFLGFLHETLIDHDFSALPVWLDTRWLGYWTEAANIYQSASPCFGDLKRAVSQRWNLNEATADAALPTLWAVLSGYPEGGRRRRQPTAPAPAPVGTIRLRGFRRVH